MYIYIHMKMYIYKYVYMYMYMYIYRCICLDRYKHTDIHMFNIHQNVPVLFLKCQILSPLTQQIE